MKEFYCHNCRKYKKIELKIDSIIGRKDRCKGCQEKIDKMLSLKDKGRDRLRNASIKNQRRRNPDTGVYIGDIK